MTITHGSSTALPAGGPIAPESADTVPSLEPLTPSNVFDPANKPPPYGSDGAAAWHAHFVSTRPQMPTEHNENTYYNICVRWDRMRRYHANQAAELQSQRASDRARRSAQSQRATPNLEEALPPRALVHSLSVHAHWCFHCQELWRAATKPSPGLAELLQAARASAAMAVGSDAAAAVAAMIADTASVGVQQQQHQQQQAQQQAQLQQQQAAAEAEAEAEAAETCKRAAVDCGGVANEEVRGMKRRLGVAEETVRIKKERLEVAVQEYDEEHRTFTMFSKRLEEKWEQRFHAVAALARAAGVRFEDIEAARKQEWRAGSRSD